MLKINPQKKLQTLLVNNLKILKARFSGYYFYTNLNIWGDFQICISVSLSKKIR